MQNSKVKEGTQIPKQQKPRLIEMSDGTLRIRSGWAYLYILPGMALLLLFTIYPLIMVLRTAFYQKYIYITNTGEGFAFPHLPGSSVTPHFGWLVKTP